MARALRKERAAGKPQSRLSHAERRGQLEEATLTCLARYGAQGAGLRQVCRDLGVAPSLVSYFFDGWEGLLLSAYRLLEKRALDEYRQIAKMQGTARERLDRLIERNVSPAWLSDEVVGAYIALWDLSRTMPELKAEFTRFHRARRRIVSALFSELTGTRRRRADADLLAAGFVVFLDGLWLELGLNPRNLRPRDAVRMCRIWIDANFLSSRRAARR
jgi:TetR/AcrR family transcriptional regulator, transcriptional repressor of bet genes